MSAFRGSEVLSQRLRFAGFTLVVLGTATFAMFRPRRDDYAEFRNHFISDKSGYLSASEMSQGMISQGKPWISYQRNKRWRLIEMRGVKKYEVAALARKLANERDLTEEAKGGKYWTFKGPPTFGFYYQRIGLTTIASSDPWDGTETVAVDETIDLDFWDELRIRVQHGGRIPFERL